MPYYIKSTLFIFPAFTPWNPPFGHNSTTLKEAGLRGMGLPVIRSSFFRNGWRSHPSSALLYHLDDAPHLEMALRVAADRDQEL